MALVMLLGAPGLGDHTSPAFRSKLVRIGLELRLDPGLMACVMSFETGGTFSPSIKNMAGSGATGLIQFMPSTAKILGTTTAELAAMSAEEQLDYVRKFYAPWAGRLVADRDYYMAVFSPAWVGKPLATPMYSAPSKAYEQNRGLDGDGDGVITVGDVAKRFGATVAKARAAAPIAVLVDDPPLQPPRPAEPGGDMGGLVTGGLSFLLLLAKAVRR